MNTRKLILIGLTASLASIGAFLGANAMGADRSAQISRSASNAAIEPSDQGVEFLNAVSRWSGESAATLASRNRIAMSDLGAQHTTLELSTREDGSVCAALHGAGSCTSLDTPGRLWWAALRVGPSDPLQVFGVVGSDVTGVEVVARGMTYVAKIANGGFYVELAAETQDSDLNAFVSVFSDGSRVKTTPFE